MWLPGGIVDKIAEMSPSIALKARELIRWGKFDATPVVRIKPADAVHLATAISWKCHEIQTYNVDDFTPFAAHCKIVVANPKVAQPKLFDAPTAERKEVGDAKQSRT